MKIRSLLPPAIFLLFLLFGISLASGTSKPLRTVWVKVVADQHFARQSSWEKKARKELDKVSDLLAEHIGIRLEITGYEYWHHENDKDLKRLAAQMIEDIDRGQADFLIGFTLRSGSRNMKSLRNDGVTLAFQGMLLKMYQGSVSYNSFLPIITLHEIVHMFGGVHINDGSLMSPQLENSIRVALDPINRRIIDITREIDFKEGYSSLEPAGVSELAGLYEKAIAEGNDEIPTYLELGSMYMTLGQYKRAIDPFRRVIEIHDPLEYAWLSWGDCYYKLGLVDSAIDVFERAIPRVEDKGQFFHRLAVLYYNQREFEKSYLNALNAEKHDFPVNEDLWERLQDKKESFGL